MEKEEGIPAAAPLKRRLSSILKTGNSIRPDDTEGNDITTGFGLSGPQATAGPVTATVGLPRRVSFCEQPQILDISPLYRSTDEPSESECSASENHDDLNKTSATNVSMEMSYDEAAGGAAANLSHINNTTLDKTCAVNVPMEMTHIATTNPNQYGHATGSTMADMSLGGATMAKGWGFADVTDEEMDRTIGSDVPMDMSHVRPNTAVKTMMNATAVNTMDMSLCGETAVKIQTHPLLNEHEQLGKTVAQNISMDISNVNLTGLNGPVTATANVTVDMSFGTTAAATTSGRGYVEVDDEELGRTVRNDMPMEMITGHTNMKTMNSIAANMVDMSLCGENAVPPPDNDCTNLIDPSKSCGIEIPMEMSQTAARTMGVTIASDMSLSTVSAADEEPEDGNENLNFDPAPVPIQVQGQRLVHPSEISARPNVLPPKFQPARVAQMANAPNLADNSQFVEFLLRNPVPTSQQQQGNANHVVPSSSSGYGQFGSAKTPKRNWNTSHMGYPHHAHQYCDAHGPPPPVQIQKIILTSVESQTSPQTNLISIGTAITPKEPQKSLEVFTTRRDFQQQTCTPEGEQPRIQLIREKEEVQVLAPAAPPPRNEEPSFTLGGQGQGEEYQDQIQPNQPTPPSSAAIQPTAASAAGEVTEPNHRRETYTVQKHPILPQSQIVEVDGQETTPTTGIEGILGTSNLSFASTTSSEPEPETDDTHPIQDHLMQGQSRSSDQTIQHTDNAPETERMRCASPLDSTANFGLGLEIHPLRPEDQSNNTFRIGAASDSAFQAPMASSTMNLSQSQSQVSQVECLTRETLLVNNNGNATFRVQTNTTIIQETSVTVSGNLPPPAMATTSFSQFGGTSASERDLMPPPTPRDRPTAVTAPSFLATPQPRESSSFAMPPPDSARMNNHDMSVSMSFRDPAQQQHHLSYATWETRLGEKTRHYLQHYTKMRLGEKSRYWEPMTKELRKLTRNEFEQFAEDFAHVFPDWFLPSVLSHFEMQEVFEVPLDQYDTHPAIVAITGGPGAPKLRSLEELLSVKWTLPPVE